MKKAIPNYVDGEVTLNRVTDYVTIKSFEEIIKNKPAHTPHYHALLYQLCWISKGDYSMTVESETFHLKRNSLFILKPGTVHFELHHSSNLEGYVIHFSQDFLAQYASVNRFFSQVIEKKHTHTSLITNVDKESTITINRMFDEMHERYKGDLFLKNDILKSYINLILLKMYESQDLASIDSSNPVNDVYNRFINALDQNFKTKNKVHEYAEMLNVSAGHLNKIVKAETQKKTGDIIREKIIIEAQRSLIYTNESISEIAYRLNFNDHSYFWKLFKKHVGHSPKTYREKHQ